MSNILEPGFVYFDGLKYILVGAIGSTGPASGDLSGFYPNPTVVGLQGHPISTVDPTPGQILEWNGTNWIASNSSFANIAGDLGGTPSSPNVVGLYGHPLSSSTPTVGQVLVWSGSAWTPTTTAGGFSAGGDLSGTSVSQTVIRINGATVPAAGSLTDGYFLQVTGSSALTYGPVNSLQGNPVQAQTLGAGQSNYALVWNGSTWGAENVFLNQSAGGDLGDFYPNPTTRALWHAAIPQVLPSNPTATPGFVIGNVLQVTNVTANTQALGYGTLNLGTGGATTNVSGTLPNANQAPQVVTGDLVGYTNNSGSSYNSNFYGATVTKLQNIPLSSDGYVNYGTGDHFISDFTGPSGFGNPNAWCVFSNTINGQQYQFCIQTDGYVGLRIKYSKSGFTGGTLTQSATAPDETLIFGSGTNASPTYQQTLGGRIVFQTSSAYMNFDTSVNRFAFNLSPQPLRAPTHLAPQKPLITKTLK